MKARPARTFKVVRPDGPFTTCGCGAAATLGVLDNQRPELPWLFVCPACARKLGAALLGEAL